MSGNAKITALSAFHQEESPDSTGHPAAESADRSNLVDTVTENNRILVMQG